MYDVAVVTYEKPFESLKKAVDLAGGLGDVSAGSKVVIKPNICVWYEGADFPKYGVLTTARLIEDMVGVPISGRRTTFKVPKGFGGYANVTATALLTEPAASMSR